MKHLANLWWWLRRQVRHHGTRILVATAAVGAGLVVAAVITSGATVAHQVPMPTTVPPTVTVPPTTVDPTTTTAVPGPTAPDPAPPVPDSAVLDWNDDGTPVSFGCTATPIEVQYDPTGAPYDAAADLEVVVPALAQAFGRPIELSADVPPPDEERPGTIAIRWVPTAADLPGQPGPTTLGVGGPSIQQTGADRSEIVSGAVTLNADMGLEAGGGPDGAQQLYLHELLHALGADHRPEGTADTVMTPTLGSGGSDGSLGGLDREVLDALGRGCTAGTPSRLTAGGIEPTRIQIPIHPSTTTK